jgi:Family of unknown function (DUF6807)
MRKLILPWYYGSVCLIGVFSSLRAASPLGRVVVHAGLRDRSHTVVTFALPKEQRGAQGLKDSTGKVVDLQVDPDGMATFIENRLSRGQSKTYTLVGESAGNRARRGVEISLEGNLFRIGPAGSHIAPLSFQSHAGPLPRKDIKPVYLRGGYLHPILSPSGLLVSDDYPPNHIHHHGLWFAWTKTEFDGLHPDFWNMGEAKGTVEFVDMAATWNGPIEAGFRSRHRYRELISPDRTIVLNEDWEVRFYAGPPADAPVPYWMFDLTSTQRCATERPLKLPKYYYGGLGFRGNRAWNGKDRTFFLTSEGETNRVRGNETRGRWCYIGGLVEGRQTGIVIMCHPSNYRAPQPMRLHPTEPFFCFAPQQLGEMEIVPGQPYVSRYRCVILDGTPDPKPIERLYGDYAFPPTVDVLKD